MVNCCLKRISFCTAMERTCARLRRRAAYSSPITGRLASALLAGTASSSWRSVCTISVKGCSLIRESGTFCSSMIRQDISSVSRSLLMPAIARLMRSRILAFCANSCCWCCFPAFWLST
ncbi:hypothetical protein FQZ97_1079970 [compost metagenome]